ncbi:acetate kinase [Pseudohongiella sp.]|uniref:Acetate kinase n=1 Tax=marine sediment metagenome TaxID=412755 RepID=A0A0F9YW67_9ZZZZ|nr:acetate kinase [Pseudohongiella sp.]HDZ07903.1 acetate kinase [Pseudohongiella sp.]HEA64490.1 acetate kinase [Pseudohongiella sp.]
MAVQTVLACNGGSSTLKLARFTPAADGTGWQQSTRTLEGDAAALLRDFVADLDATSAPDVILHRIVHAGGVGECAERIDTDVRNRIRHWLPLAPRHNGLALSLIDHLHEHLPAVPQFAIYDAGLYADLPAEAASYALPAELSPRWPVRRYGFHGLAHRSQWRQVQALSPQQTTAPRRVISLQLGSGCSVSAWLDGKVVDTSMGFTPLDGVMMARRSGALDPGIALHLLTQEGWTATDLAGLLQERAGLAAMAGHDGDLRAIVVDADARGEQSAAAVAIRQYCYQLRKTIGSYIAVLGGVDAISFGGGVGENQPRIRAGALQGLEGLGIELDCLRNQGGNSQSATAARLHSDNSTTAIYLTPVNEMREMLRQYEAH